MSCLATNVPHGLAPSIESDRYLQPHQARQREATVFEDLLGDAIERAFASGVETLPELIACLNRTGPAGENGLPWTEQRYLETIANLGL